MTTVHKLTRKMMDVVNYVIYNPQVKYVDVAKHFGVTYLTIYNWLHSKVVTDYWDARLALEWENTVRIALRQMNALVQRGDRRACEFTLKTRPAFNPVQQIEADVSNKMITIKVEDDTGNTEQETI